MFQILPACLEHHRICDLIRGLEGFIDTVHPPAYNRRQAVIPQKVKAFPVREGISVLCDNGFDKRPGRYRINRIFMFLADRFFEPFIVLRRQNKRLRCVQGHLVHGNEFLPQKSLGLVSTDLPPGKPDHLDGLTAFLRELHKHFGDLIRVDYRDWNK